jgi:hypothetical protein
MACRKTLSSSLKLLVLGICLIRPEIGVLAQESLPQDLPAETVLDSIERLQQERTRDSLKRAALDRIPRDTSALSEIVLDSEILDSYRSRRKFQYIEQERRVSWIDRALYWLGDQVYRFLEWIFGAERAGVYFRTFLKYLPYLMLAILAFLVFRFFSKTMRPSSRGRNSRAQGVFLTEEEALMEEADLSELGEKARSSGDFRLALRFGFLELLRLLRQKELISWQAQKTNQDYLNEVLDSDLYPHFQESVRWYEFTWYGGFELSETDYNHAVRALERVRETADQS